MTDAFDWHLARHGIDGCGKCYDEPMCYSAMVEQDARKYERFGKPFSIQVRVQPDMYDDLFSRRLAGEKLYLNKAMEYPFVHDAKSPAEKAIRKKILEWHEFQIPILEKELFAQKRRLADAERTLKTKTTKKAENDKRIATDKIEKYLADIEKHKSKEIESDGERRIFPNHYMSMLALDDDGKPIVMPVRYLLRPHGKDESFDYKFNGCYNARYDSLDRVAWWKDALGRRHGMIMVKQFYENVAAEDYAKKHKLPKGSEDKKNLVLCFKPDNVDYMFIPCLWDKWESKGQPSLYSAALITDEPLPEIAEAGHDRTPIFLKEDAVADWLRAKGRSVKELEDVLGRRERPHYSHKVMGAA